MKQTRDYICKLQKNDIANINKIIGRESYLYMSGMEEHYVLLRVHSDSTVITVAPLTHDFESISILNAVNLNGDKRVDGKLSHIRDNFSFSTTSNFTLNVDNSNQVQKLEEYFKQEEETQKHLFGNKLQKIARDIEPFKEIIHTPGNLNLTTLGESVNFGDNLIKQQYKQVVPNSDRGLKSTDIQINVLKVKTDTVDTKILTKATPFEDAIKHALKMRIPVNDHTMLNDHFIKNNTYFTSKKKLDLDEHHSFHSKWSVQLIKDAKSTTTYTELAESNIHRIKHNWIKQAELSKKLVKAIEEIKNRQDT